MQIRIERTNPDGDRTGSYRSGFQSPAVAQWRFPPRSDGPPGATGITRPTIARSAASACQHGGSWQVSPVACSQG